MERLFKLVYFAGMLAEIILRMPYERQRRQIPKIDQRVSRTERDLLVVLSLGGFFIPLIYNLTSWLDFANYHWSPATKARVGSIGTVLLGAAIWLFWRSHRDLGKNWSPSLEISAQQTLITHGVLSHDPSPDVCLWVAIEPCPSLAPAELGCWACRCSGIPALIFPTSTARRANDARSLWRCLPELCCTDGSDCAALAWLTPAPAPTRASAVSEFGTRSRVTFR